MSTIEKIAGQTRTKFGSTASRRLRAEGRVPAILYGHKEEPQALSLQADEAEEMARTVTRVLDLDLDGNLQKVLVKKVQWDTFSRDIIHVDLMRVDANERIHAQVPVVTRGSSPGVAAGGVLDQHLHSLDVECLAVEMPDHIVVKIGALQMGDVVHVKEITDLPRGVTILTQEDLVVFQVLDPDKVQMAGEPEGEEASPSEPEIVGEGANDSEDGDS
ncbi:MAG: 50S ribosomal protein L25 [Planctomycetaceae bacterium]|nr:50S ribosomal protein L25 [Planctomycetaceae bacterium]